MGVPIITWGGVLTPAQTSLFFPIGTGSNSTTTTEQNVEWTVRTAGIYSKLQLVITANGSSSVVIRFRINRNNGAQVVSPGAATGYFEDTTNPDPVVAGDEVNCSYAAANTNAVTMIGFGVSFTAATGVATRVGGSSFAGQSYTAAGTDNFVPSFEALSAGNTEANCRVPVQCAFTRKNLYIYVSSNARTTTTDFRSRVNGADGNLLVQYTTLQTGVVEDTSTSDNLVAGDFYCGVIRTAAIDVGSIVVHMFTTDMVNTATLSVPYVFASQGFAANNTSYVSLGGRFVGVNNPEASSQLKAEQGGVIRNLTFTVTANTVTATSTWKSRINTADGTIIVSIGSGATGTFSDVTHSDHIERGDLLAWQIVTGATGTTLRPRQGSVEFLSSVGIPPILFQRPLRVFKRAA